LDNQTRKVAAAGKGVRNQTLNDAALSLGHLVAAGALVKSVVRHALEDAARSNGLTKDDGVGSVRATINSALRAGMQKPADLSGIGKRSATRRRQPDSAVLSSRPSHGVPDAPREADASEPLSDLGNAQCFVSQHRDDFRFCPVLGWLAWTGSHWSLDQAEGLVSKAVHQVVRAIRDESDDERVQKWAHTSEGARHIA
jgi:hypothetical protein